MYSLFKKALLSKDKLVFEQLKTDDIAQAPVTAVEIAAVLNSFGSLGYTLDVQSIRMLSQADMMSLVRFYNENYILLTEAKGANVQHKVFYPNFPDMAKITPDEYIVRAVLHYITMDKDDYGFVNQDIAPHVAQKVDNEKKTVLSVITEEQADNMLVQMANNALEQNRALSEYDRGLYGELWKRYSERILPAEIPFKENMALYVTSFFNPEDLQSEDFLYKKLSFCKTLTDILRVYAAMSSGKADLVPPVFFCHLSREARRAILHKINDFCHRLNADEDFRRHEFLWKRATELLHPYDYRKKYPVAFDHICRLRSGKLEKSFESCLENSIRYELGYITFLSTRPTEYARRLDFMLRTFSDTARVFDTFVGIIDDVSVGVLHSLWNYYLNRADLSRYRDFVFYKGHTVSVEVAENRPELSSELCDKVVNAIKDELRRRFASYPQIGKLYIADSMQNYTLPISSRESSGQVHTLNYGTKLSLDDEQPADFVRLFTHWKNGRTRVDIDLSVELISENLEDAISLSWHNMDGGRLFDSYHSGDITTAPEGASEFVDLSISKAREYGRYALVCNSCYTGQPFRDVPECFSGVMFMPERAKEGEVFNPQFVKFKFDLTQRTNSNIAFALDLETRELIWMDTNRFCTDGGSVVAAEDYGIIVALRKVLQKRANVAEWMKLHTSHLQLTDNREEADYVVDVEGKANVNPTDAEDFAVKWM